MKRLPILLLFLLIGCQPVSTSITPTGPVSTIPGVTAYEPTEPTAPVQPPPVSSTDAQAVLSLVNQARASQHLSPLAINAQLQAMASQMGSLMQQSGKMDHRLGGGFQARLNQSGYRYRSAGENIAQGQRSPAEVMTAWMNDPGHRANILGAAYRDIGIAHSGAFWDQDFGQPAAGGAAVPRAWTETPAIVDGGASSVRFEPK